MRRTLLCQPGSGSPCRVAGKALTI